MQIRAAAVISSLSNIFTGANQSRIYNCCQERVERAAENALNQSDFERGRIGDAVFQRLGRCRLNRAGQIGRGKCLTKLDEKRADPFHFLVIETIWCIRLLMIVMPAPAQKVASYEPSRTGFAKSAHSWAACGEYETGSAEQ